jgi:mannose-6-phosphate isomerase-like protein (cupin superfamily)
MRKAFVGFLAAAIVGGPHVAAAQSSANAASSQQTATDVKKAEIQAAVAKGIAALLPGVTVNDRLVSLADAGKYNVAVAVVVRPAGHDTRVLSHDKITEVYYILRGSGTQVTGTLVGGTHSDASATIGPGMSGDKPLQNARSGTLGPGDVQIIPAGLGHGWSSIEPGGIEYLVFRVDPERLLQMPK